MKTSNPQQRNSMGEASLAVTKVKLEHVNGKVDLALMISKNGVNPDMSRDAIRTLTGITAWKHITHLQLQHNHLSSLAPLAGLHKLRILSVAANELTSIDGLSNLLNLRYLDASENRMADFNAGWFPASLESLDLSANPCATAPDHRLRIIYACKYLAVLDTQDVTREELRLARMSLGNDEERLAAFDQMPEMGRGSELEDDDVPETRPGDEGMTWDLGGTHASSSDSISNFPLEPFKKTVDDIIERSRVRQADTDKDSKSRMEALITQIRADGASRSCRLREIIQSLN
ncbi:hypothetical protein BC830DRAFT_933806 [Chytriomyces sp. MP71]|nr:hypothetical protein BC830DRAFT_933806 [Chytriomyces sp. MP71]